MGCHAIHDINSVTLPLPWQKPVLPTSQTCRCDFSKHQAHLICCHEHCGAIYRNSTWTREHVVCKRRQQIWKCGSGRKRIDQTDHGSFQGPQARYTFRLHNNMMTVYKIWHWKHNFMFVCQKALQHLRGRLKPAHQLHFQSSLGFNSLKYTRILRFHSPNQTH